MSNIALAFKIIGEWSVATLPYLLSALGVYLAFCIIYMTITGDPLAVSKLINRLLEG